MTQLGAANLSPFTSHFLFEHGDISHSVFKKGDGPGLILMHEIFGMTDTFWRLANWMSEHFTVYAPDLYGASDVPTSANKPRNAIRACISREIHLLKTNDPGPVTQWLRSLSKQLHDTIQGPGIGVVGMCMTGNFALTLALDPWVTAPVTSQPGLPGSIRIRKRDQFVQMSEVEKQQLAAIETDAMGLRFEGDRICRAARFDAIREIIGDERFREHVIADKHGSPDGTLRNPHSVLTDHLVDEDDSVTKQKLIDVIDFLKDRISG